MIYFSAIVAACAVYFCNFPGINGFYMNYWWYDIFMHILGGLGVGLLFGSLLTLFRIVSTHPKKFIILGALIIGVLWECFELYFKLTGHPVGSGLYFFDTSLDLINDVIGGFLASLIYIKLKK